MYSNVDGKVAAIWVRGNNTPSPKEGATKEDGNTTMGTKGSNRGVTVLGGPEGLVIPFMGPC